MPNPFEIFAIEEKFELDINALNKKYFELQQQFHPDKTKDNGIKSAEINLAYNTLKNPLKRAEYMAGSDLKACPALLLEVMELRESGDIQTARNEVEKLYKDFSAASKEQRKEIFVKIKYLTKFIEDSE